MISAFDLKYKTPLTQSKTAVSKKRLAKKQEKSESSTAGFQFRMAESGNVAMTEYGSPLLDMICDQRDSGWDLKR